MEEVGHTLEDRGVDGFHQSFAHLLTTLAVRKHAKLTSNDSRSHHPRRTKTEMRRMSHTVDYRSELKLAEHDVNPETWAGGLEANGLSLPGCGWGGTSGSTVVADSDRFRPAGARRCIGEGLHDMPAVQEFITRHPGADKPAGPALGMPAWVGWDALLHLFSMTFRHPTSDSDPLRPSAALLSASDATPGKDEWLRVAVAGPARRRCGPPKTTRSGCPGSSDCPGSPFRRLGFRPIVTLRVTCCGSLTGRLLYPAVHHRPVAACCADQLGTSSPTQRRWRSSTCRWTGRR